MTEELADSIFAIEKRLDTIEAWQKNTADAYNKNSSRVSERLQTLERTTAEWSEKLDRINARLRNSEAAQKPPERRWRRLWRFLAAAAGIALILASVASMFVTLPMNKAFCHKFGGQTVRAEDGRFACWIDLD